MVEYDNPILDKAVNKWKSLVIEINKYLENTYEREDKDEDIVRHIFTRMEDVKTTALVTLMYICKHELSPKEIEKFNDYVLSNKFLEIRKKIKEE